MLDGVEAGCGEETGKSEEGVVEGEKSVEGVQDVEEDAGEGGGGMCGDGASV